MLKRCYLHSNEGIESMRYEGFLPFLVLFKLTYAIFCHHVETMLSGLDDGFLQRDLSITGYAHVKPF
ncbi:hypothetical protein DKX38_003466 [Salix brachista]|uniref:Uncharacterized protein n=1 Tax=Salix brachista TaxID=2182728 RepID=A0A5N5NS64_9ROSI|nr:hypothetical protein DKX38_003466 [Salix brachista]